jgi:hypothetical protein
MFAKAPKKLTAYERKVFSTLLSISSASIDRKIFGLSE